MTQQLDKKKMSLGEYVKAFRKLQHLSLLDFANRAHISKPYAQILEGTNPTTGTGGVPSIIVAKGLANAMYLTLDDIYELTMNGADQLSARSLRQVPKSTFVDVYSDLLHLGDAAYCVSELAVPNECIRARKRHYAFVIQDNSMEGYGLKKGGIAIIGAGKVTIKDGEIGVFDVNGTAYIRKYEVGEGGTVTLKADNPDFEDIVVTDPESMEVIGILDSVYMNLHQ